MKTDNQTITTDEYVDRKTAAELTEKVTGEIMSQLEANEKKMKHYTEFIPKDLGTDLQKVGMKIEWEDNSPDEHPNTEVNCLTTYAEVMDWFIDRELKIGIFTNYWTPRLYFARVNGFDVGVANDIRFTIWHSAANTAIKRAIKLLEERK